VPVREPRGEQGVLCSHCHGKHVVITDGGVRPCEECGGLGEIHCCEGLQAQPEAEPPPGSLRQAGGPATPNRGQAP
jgi:hypothetical protein